jgi:hypothetical protein
MLQIFGLLKTQSYMPIKNFNQVVILEEIIPFCPENYTK